VTLASQTTPAFFIGINDPLGGNPHLTPFTPAIFDLFGAWVNPQSHGENDRDYGGDPSGQRASIARGQVLFNSKPIQITNVAGLNDDLNLAILPGTCGTCHDSPDVGNHSVSARLRLNRPIRLNLERLRLKPWFKPIGRLFLPTRKLA
jgi:hypothetical protein